MDVADSGGDAPSDTSRDAPLVDGGHIDDWLPAFSPRVIYRNDEITCHTPDLTYRPTPRPAAPRGTVLWTYRPREDPAAPPHFIAAGAEALFWHQVPFFGRQDGGVIAMVDGHMTHAVVDDQGVLVGALRGYGGINWMLVGDQEYVLRDQIEYRGLAVEGTTGADRHIPRDLIDRVLPGVWRTPATSLGGYTRLPAPALLPDGAVVWSPTTATLMASCPDTGLTRWIVEFDTAPFVGDLNPRPEIFVDRDGDIIVWAHAIYRLSSRGELLAQRPPRRGSINVRGYSERCGLIGYSYRDGDQRVVFLRGEALDEERSIPVPPVGESTASQDCGMIALARSGIGYVRQRWSPDGTLTWEVPNMGTAMVELTDGSFLELLEGSSPPRLRILAAEDGEVVWDQTYDPAEVGMHIDPNSRYLSPDGVLYLGTYDGLSSAMQLTAIDLGIGPAVPHTDSIAGTNGLDWARTRGTWLTAEE